MFLFRWHKIFLFYFPDNPENGKKILFPYSVFSIFWKKKNPTIFIWLRWASEIEISIQLFLDFFGDQLEITSKLNSVFYFSVLHFANHLWTFPVIKTIWWKKWSRKTSKMKIRRTLIPSFSIIEKPLISYFFEAVGKKEFEFRGKNWVWVEKSKLAIKRINLFFELVSN